MTIIHKNAGIFADFLADYLKGAIKTYKIHFPQITLKSILKRLIRKLPFWKFWRTKYNQK